MAFIDLSGIAEANRRVGRKPRSGGRSTFRSSGYRIAFPNENRHTRPTINIMGSDDARDFRIYARRGDT